jgi:hypothetical protein
VPKALKNKSGLQAAENQLHRKQQCAGVGCPGILRRIEEEHVQSFHSFLMFKCRSNIMNVENIGDIGGSLLFWYD